MQKLRVGRRYLFHVEKEVTLPDGSNHFLLSGPDENKYLVPVAKYIKYDIKIGASLKCRVDRISCKGEFFLEPENPWYKEGKYYDFTIVGIATRTDKFGAEQEVLIVSDIDGNNISVQLPITPVDKNPGSKLKFRIERITKGKVHLVRAEQNAVNSPLKTGKAYEFEIERVERGMDDEDCFIVRDPLGHLHTIVKSYYEHYGFNIGSRFSGKVIKKKTSGEMIIEPVNPFYNEGSIIKMEITGFYKNLVNNSFTLNLKDEFGFVHCIDVLKPPDGKSVKCRVVMIKKGKPLLRLL